MACLKYDAFKQFASSMVLYLQVSVDKFFKMFQSILENLKQNKMAYLTSFHFRYIYFAVVALMLFPLMFSLMTLHQTENHKKDSPGKNLKRRSLLLHDLEVNETDSAEPLNVAGDEIPLAKESYEAGFSDARPTICPDLGKGRSLLIMITSAPSNEESRTEIRKAWGKYAKSQNVSVGFIIGSTDNETVIEALKKEQKVYEDLVITKSVDTYNNLTLKTIAVLEWTKDFCSKIGFVLKTDDDVFINIFRLMEFISSQDPTKDAIYGRLARNWKPGRNVSSKYYISPQEFFPETFPEFTTGPAYILSANLAEKLHHVALKTKYFKLEDVFLTGIVASGLKIRRVPVTDISNRRITYDICNVQRLISIHPVKMEHQAELWETAQDETPTFCRSR